MGVYKRGSSIKVYGSGVVDTFLSGVELFIGHWGTVKARKVGTRLWKSLKACPSPLPAPAAPKVLHR